MNKSELVEEIAKTLDATQKDTAEFVRAFVEVVQDALKKGDSVVIPGFGAFSVTERAARMARDFKSGNLVKVPATKCVKFKAGKTLKDTVK